MPWYGDKVAFAAETGWSLAVNSNAKEQEAIFDFLAYFFQEDVILKHNIASSQIPANKEVAHNPELIKEMPYAAPLVDILDKSQFIGYFNTDQFKEKINDVFVDYVSGNYKTVDEATKALNEELNATLK